MEEGKERIVGIDDREFERMCRYVAARAGIISDILRYIYREIVSEPVRRKFFENFVKMHQSEYRFPFNEKWIVVPEDDFMDIKLIKGSKTYWLSQLCQWQKEIVGPYAQKKLEFLDQSLDYVWREFFLDLSTKMNSELLWGARKVAEQLLKEKMAANKIKEQKEDLEKEVSQLKNAAEKAAKDLLNTKGICKSKRIAEIRENLERALGGRFLNGRFVMAPEPTRKPPKPSI